MKQSEILASHLFELRCDSYDEPVGRQQLP